MLSSLRGSKLSSYARHGVRSMSTEPVTERQHLVPPRPFKNEFLSIYIRPTSSVHHMSDLLSIIRSVEGHIGPMVDYSLKRDPYDRQEYFRTAFHARLRHADDWKAIPSAGTTIQVELPVIAEQAGGVGIADIQHLLYPKERVQEDDFQFLMGQPQTASDLESSSKDKPQTRMIDVKIEPSKRVSFEDVPYNRYLVSMDRANAIGRAFVGWGGFYQPPASSGAEAATSSTPPLSHMTHMQEKFRQQSSEASDVSAVEEELDAEVADEEISLDEALLPEVEGQKTDAAEDLAETFATQKAVEQPSSPEAPAPLQSPTPQPTGEQHPPVLARSKRRERLLELARQNATRPLTVKPSEPALDDEQQKQTLQDEKARERMARETIRERLWKLMGGKIL